MNIDTNIVNKVAESGLISFDLATIRPKGERIVYDLAQNLFQGLILREKEFRLFLKEHDWLQYQDKHVALMCSVDAIVPQWAYMLLVAKLQRYAQTVSYGDLQQLEVLLFDQAINKLDEQAFIDQKVVIKGCAGVEIPLSAYVALTAKLSPIVSSLMYGEPCSTVPIIKNTTKIS